MKKTRARPLSFGEYQSKLRTAKDLYQRHALTKKEFDKYKKSLSKQKSIGREISVRSKQKQQRQQKVRKGLRLGVKSIFSTTAFNSGYGGLYPPNF